MPTLTQREARSGLSDADANERLRRDGYNELPSARPRSLAAIALEAVREPMFLLLIASGGIYLLLGDPEEAAALLAAVFMVIGITLYQEHKTERALDALRDLSSPRALVIRDGVLKRIAGRDVVTGDLVVLREGDRVPADGHLVSCRNLAIDESLLTGESVPVRKAAGAPPASPEPPGGDDRPLVYSGTLVVRGEGVASVLATGARTELGKIGATLARLDTGRTALQSDVSRIVRWLASAGLAACVIVAVAYGITRGRWLDGALAGLTLAISMVPEEFPVILTVFLALGAWRISRNRVLTRRIPAIETLGSATVLCVDKTGTLTTNHMTVEVVDAEDPRRLIAASVLASKPDAVDPMDRAFVESGAAIGVETPRPESLVREYPLTENRLAVVNVWRTDTDATYRAAAKGAPEAILDLCRISGDSRTSVLQQVDAMAARGLRVLAVAEAKAISRDLPADPQSLPLQYLGLIGLADPVRPGVPSAIDECRSAGIRVVMITGDYPATAMKIARDIRLTRPNAALTGPDIAAMDDAELGRRVQEVDVFARMVPEQKLRLVRALKANGEVVAMTGDGVNDAPALKAADIGVAMGARGTDVAREAAGLVLLDDDFSSIVRAARLGRRIYDNIEKATSYVLAIHVPIAGVSLVPALAGWPLVLMPVHVILMELIIDPACSIAFEMEPEERDVMSRPPRQPGRRLFTRSLVLRSVLQGFGAFAAIAFVLFSSHRVALSDEDVRMLTFSTLLMTNLMLIVVNRSLTRPAWRSWGTRNPAIRWLAAGAVCVLGAIFYIPSLRDVFRMARPHVADLTAIALTSVVALIWMELVKRVFAGRTAQQPAGDAL